MVRFLEHQTDSDDTSCGVSMLVSRQILNKRRGINLYSNLELRCSFRCRSVTAETQAQIYNVEARVRCKGMSSISGEQNCSALCFPHVCSVYAITRGIFEAPCRQTRLTSCRIWTLRPLQLHEIATSGRLEVVILNSVFVDV